MTIDITFMTFNTNGQPISM